MRRITLPIIFTAMLSSLSVQADYRAEESRILALAELTDTPVVRNEKEQIVSIGAGELKTIYFDALIYEGKPTRVYAWIGIPEDASSSHKVPGIVLIHGGGGTAFKEWVEKWNARGYAAISIAVEGQIDEREPRKPGDTRRNRWKKHPWSGPVRAGIYGDSDKPIEEQWMYHAVADAILSNSLLRSLSQVDSTRVGLMGISWGGIIASTVIGIDDRFAFVIPTYGCGNLSQAANQYGRALGNNDLYKEVWDPILRLKKVEIPTLWLSWPGDQHFPLDKQASCYRTVSGPYMVCLIPGMKHGHQPGMKPPDSYAFADSVVKEGKPWARQISSETESGQFTVIFESSRPLDEAFLISTTDTGITGKRKWFESPAKLKRMAEHWVVTATQPEGTTACFINVKSGGLTLTSDYTKIE